MSTSATGATLIEAKGVTKRYGAYVALADVDLLVREGEILSIVGPNGAGKTTLVNLLTGLFPPTSGSVRFEGNDVARLGPVRLAKDGLARGFQLVHVFAGLTVAETIAVAALSRLGRAQRWLATISADRDVEARVERVASIFGLTNKLRTPARMLSQGDKKLLDIASAFALEPRVILLDEPTSGVGSADKHAIMTTLIDAAKQIGLTSIILVEHDMDLVATYSDRIVALQGGRLLADLPRDEFFRNADVVAAVVGRLPKSVH